MGIDWEAELAFRKLRRSITVALILQYFDPVKAIIIQTDVSEFAIVGILNQYDVFGVLRSDTFYSQKCSPAEQNYDTYDQELLAIVETLKLWWHYPKGANYRVLIRPNHKNLNYFQISKVLSRRQVRRSEIFLAYIFVLEQPGGIKIPAHGPSRPPNYKIDYERFVVHRLETIQVEP